MSHDKRSKIPCAASTFTRINIENDEALEWVKTDRAIVRRRQGSRDLRTRADNSASLTPPILAKKRHQAALMSNIPGPSSYTPHRQRSDNSMRSHTTTWLPQTRSMATPPSTPSPPKLKHHQGDVDTQSDYSSDALVSDADSLQGRSIQHKHKDSGVHIPECLTPISSSNGSQQSGSMRTETNADGSVLNEILDTYSNSSSENLCREVTTEKPAVRRPGIERDKRHEDACVCYFCRQTRSRRRKKTLGLTQKVERCKTSMMAVRDPADPRNLERGEIYGLWLKLARLHVSYDNLVDIPVHSRAEEEALFLAFMEVFNILTRLISLEKARWPDMKHTGNKAVIRKDTGKVRLFTSKRTKLLS